DIGGGARGGVSDKIFVALMYENLIGTGDSIIGCKALFAADPLTETGTVTAELPAPFDIIGAIDLMTCLGPIGSTVLPAKTMSIITTFGSSEYVVFNLDGYSNSPQTRDGDTLTYGTMVEFLIRSYYEVTITITGEGSVELRDGSTVYGTVDFSDPVRIFKIPGDVLEIYIEATGNAGYEIETFTVNGTVSRDSPLTVIMDSDKSVIAAFVASSLGPKYYYITATSDAGSEVTPSGRSSVEDGSNFTVHFSALDGYIISAVTVDGRGLTQAEMALGSYTFRQVMANHSLHVTSDDRKNTITLSIDVMDGRGHAEYSMNGGSFAVYVSPVFLPEHANIVLKAHADGGYHFKEWRMGATVTSDPERSFEDVTSSIHLELYFAEAGGSLVISDEGGSMIWWALGIIALLLLLGLLLWFALFYRRTYEVIKVTPSEAIGKDRARRKRAYTFTGEEAFGTVSYKVGEDGQWKSIIAAPNGEYTIPKDEVVDAITIEFR
ncbi:MAG: hypothetical protein LBH88_02430, partial [Candidatus Methanoplasma sp.]|nr:hypothetical protein [Candidatus Methanoplasma sp.]